MPRYGDPDYDRNFDDSPPPSPKLRAFKHASRSSSSIGLLGRRIWRARTTILVVIIIAGVIYLLSSLGGQRTGKPAHNPTVNYKNVDWKMYAYVQYATDSAHLCNAIMLFEALHRLGSKAQRVLLYTDSMDTIVDSGRDRDSQLLKLAVESYGVKLVPTSMEQFLKSAPPVYANLMHTSPDQVGFDRSISKMLAFNQTDYLRVIHLDNDVTLYQNLDDLFLLPPATIAMPRAYWLDQDAVPTPEGVIPEARVKKDVGLLSPHLMVVEPSSLETARIWSELDSAGLSPAETSLDVVILNKLYKDIAMILPHRTLALQTGEFRRKLNDHQAYLGLASKPLDGGKVPVGAAWSVERWDSHRILRETRLIHFSGDEPLPKPWKMWPKNLMRLIRPKCGYLDGTPSESDCEERDIWTGFYDDFRRRRKDVCKVLSVPASVWRPFEAKAPAGEADGESESKSKS